MFISGLLDLTDNLVNGQIAPPVAVRRLDEDDPIWWWPPTRARRRSPTSPTACLKHMASGWATPLPRAARLATTTKMGITARGAWESVKRHFRHLGVNTQTQDFTVIGIGDMAGDVFGNGMLLSEHIRLLAAFNHQHIFMTPTRTRR